MRFLTICFVMWYIFLLFKMKDIYGLVNKVTDFGTDKIEEILEVGTFEERKELIFFVVFGGFSFILGIIEFFYMFFALSYLPNVIGIGYILFWFFVLIKGIIRNKKNKQVKLTTRSYIYNTIDLLYYLCMVKVLFL